MSEAEVTTTETAPAAEATEAPAAEAPEANPNLLGKATDEENEEINQLKSQVQALLANVGRNEVRLSRMKVEVDKVRTENDQMVAEVERCEAVAQEKLQTIGERFGIQKGQPWQLLPDGSVFKIDPELLRQAQEARAAALAKEAAESSD